MAVGYHIFEHLYRDKPKYEELLRVTYSFNLSLSRLAAQP